MGMEDLEQYRNKLGLDLYHEHEDIVSIFTYAVETERRFCLCNAVDLKARIGDNDAYCEVSMGDAWAWDIYRLARFVKGARVLTFHDVSIEKITHSDFLVPNQT